jgi:hypothetical protein
VKLFLLDDLFAIAKLSSSEPLPLWILNGKFFSITKTEDELSVVCEQSLLPKEFKAEKDWRILKVQGPLDFALTGILSSISKPLADSKISIFAVSTYETDYVLIKAGDLKNAILALKSVGFEFPDTLKF